MFTEAKETNLCFSQRIKNRTTSTHREIQHAVLQHKVVGPLDVLSFLQERVVDAGVGEAARQVSAGQRLHRHLWHSDRVAHFLHVLGEEVGVADVEGSDRGVERCHSDGGDLRSNWKIQISLYCHLQIAFCQLKALHPNSLPNLTLILLIKGNLWL